MDKCIGFIGLGRLGLPVALTVESKGYKVIGYDVNPNVAKWIKNKQIPTVEADIDEYFKDTKLELQSFEEVVENSDIIFVAVQTPHEEEYDGAHHLPDTRVDFDYSFLINAVDKIAKIDKTKLVAIISTTLPGTIKREVEPIMDVIYTPQFIAKYMQEEIEDYRAAKQEEISEFITIKKLEFQLTTKQKSLIKILGENKIITVTGPPGTSKTFVACYAAIQAFLAGKCKKIVLSKPTEILSGTKDPGALPGSLDEKMAVYAESFFDAFDEILSRKDFKHLWDEKIIEFKPAQFLRGRTIKDAFIIIDEFQNFDIKALKSIVTRLGRNSTMVFMGDTKQNDIGKKFVAVDTFNKIIQPIKGCAIFKFERADIVRDPMLIDIIDRFEEIEEKEGLPDTIKNN